MINPALSTPLRAAPHELVFEPDVNASVDRIVRYCADVSAAA